MFDIKESSLPEYCDVHEFYDINDCIVFERPKIKSTPILDYIMIILIVVLFIMMLKTKSI
jgi:hypothetical protein